MTTQLTQREIEAYEKLEAAARELRLAQEAAEQQSTRRQKQVTKSEPVEGVPAHA